MLLLIKYSRPTKSFGCFVAPLTVNQHARTEELSWFTVTEEAIVNSVEVANDIATKLASIANP